MHYVCKSGAAGIGDVDKSLQTVVYLVEKCGSDPGQRCRLNSMTALHLAAYFDVAPIVGYLVSVAPNLLNSNCAAHPDSPTPLHLAAANLSLHSARILLSAGANILLKDDQMRTPLDCVPEVNEQNSSDAWYRPKEADLALDMRALLEEATLMVSGEQGAAEAETMRTAKVVLAALGLDIGHRVVVGNAKVGILRYCGQYPGCPAILSNLIRFDSAGPTQFASGIWTGVELEEQVGKNDGSVAGVSYFRCAPGYGIFAPIDKISKLDTADCYDLMLGVPAAVGSGSNGCRLNGDHSMVQSKIDTGLTNRSFPSGAGPRRHSDVHSLMSSSSSSSVNSEHIHLGSRVLLTDRKTGIVRFIGTTKFAAGIWYGIELSRQLGKHDGSIQGVRYFRCPDRYGAFVQFGRIAQILPPSRGAASRKTVSSFVDSSAAGAAESDDTSLSDMTDMSLTISGTSSLDYFHAGNPHRNGPSTASVSSLCRNQPTRNSIAGSTALRQSVGGGLRRSMSISGSRRITRTLDSVSDRDQSWLRVGVNVLVNGQVAAVRYVGPVHFADGLFLGLELRTADGKNDGSIEGKRYFTCK